MADKDLDALTSGSKAGTDAAGKLERAQKSLQDAIEKTSGAMGKFSALATTSLGGLAALEKQIASLTKAASKMDEALSGANKRLIETTALSTLGVAAIDAYVKAHKGVDQAAAAAAKTEEGVTKARSSSAAAAASQSSELRKLGKSVLDIALDLSKGEEPLKVLIDKGPALWEVFTKAREASGGLRGMLGEIGKAVAPVVDGIGSSFAGLAPLLEPLALPLVGVAAAAGVAVAGVAVTAQQIGKTVGENLDHLNLTEEQLSRVKNKGVTMGDVLAAAWKGVADVLSGVWKTVADAIVGFVGPALRAVGDFFGNLYQGIIDGIMGAVKAAFQAVGGFIGGVRGAFGALPAAIGDLVISTVNISAGALEKLANMAIGIVNKLIHMANETAAKLGIPIKLPELDTVSIGRLENKYAGAGAGLGKAMIKGANQGAADGAGAYDRVAAKVVRSVAAARDRRVLRKAGPAPEKANDAVGANSVNDNYVSSDVTSNAIYDNRNSQTTNNSVECACKEAAATVRDFSDVRPVEAVQAELLNAQKLEDEVVKAMPQPEALEPFKDSLGEIIGHFDRLKALAPDLGKAFEAAFGGSGKALTGIITAAANLGSQLATISRDQESADKNEENAVKFARRRVDATVSGFAEMSIAAKDFFDKNSSGYTALQAVERAYRAWQFAQSVQQMAHEAAQTVRSIANSAAKGAASTAAGAAKMFEVLGPFAFPAVAAMVALLAGFGLSGSGGGGSVPGVNDMKTRQDAQGSGTVLGDAKAKSDSLEKALGYAEKYQNKDLEYGNAMVRSLKSIDSQIGAVASALAKSFAAGGMLSTEGLNLGASGSAATLSNLGFAKSTTRTLQDQGLRFDAVSLGDLIAGQLVSGSTYQQVLETTKKKAFGITYSNKTRVVTETGALDADFIGQVTGLIKSLGKGVADAAKALGESDVESVLAKFQVDIGKLSFKDMTGTQIEEALNAIFGKLGDDMAKAAAPAIGQFQKVGEGAFETLVRVARQYEVIDTTLKSVGMKFGDVGAASLAARERLVELVGGLDNLTDQTGFFAEHFLSPDERLKPVKESVTQKLTDLKLPAELSREDFKKLVLAQDVSTEAGAQLYAALLALAPAFDKVATAAEAATAATKAHDDAVKEKRGSIQDQIDALTKSPSELLAASRDKERKAAVDLDASLGELLDTLWKLQDAAKVDEKRKSIQDQIDDLTLSPADKLAKSRAAEMEAVKALDASLVPFLKNLWDLQDAADAARLATERESMRADLLDAQGRTAEATALKRSLALAAITDPVQKMYQQQIWAAQDAAAKVSAAREVLTQAYQREHDAIQATKDKFAELSKTLRGFSAELSDTIAGTDPTSRYNATRQAFLTTAALARLGDADALERLRNDGEAFTTASKDYAATSQDYLRDVGLVRSAVDDAADTADRHVSIAEQQLLDLDASVQGLIEINNSVISVRDAISALRAANAQAASVGVASVGGFSTSAGAGSGAGGASYTDAQKSLNSAAFDWILVNGMAGKAAKAGADPSDPLIDSVVRNAKRYVPGYMDIVNTQGIEAANALVASGDLSYTQHGLVKFATGGSFEVGGSGPPDSKLFSLALSPGEAVNVRRRGESGDDTLVNELRRLREELADLRATSARIATSNDKMERTLTNVTEGGRAMQTQAAA